MIIPMSSAPEAPQRITDDDLSDHLVALHAEFTQAVEEMEAINATSAAAAHYAAQLTCQRFLVTPRAPEVRNDPS